MKISTSLPAPRQSKSRAKAKQKPAPEFKHVRDVLAVIMARLERMVRQ